MKRVLVTILMAFCLSAFAQAKYLREVRGKVYDANHDAGWKTLSGYITHLKGNVATARELGRDSVSLGKYFVITNCPPQFRVRSKIFSRAMLVGTIDNGYELWDCGTAPRKTSSVKSN